MDETSTLGKKTLGLVYKGHHIILEQSSLKEINKMQNICLLLLLYFN